MISYDPGNRQHIGNASQRANAAGMASRAVPIDTATQGFCIGRATIIGVVLMLMVSKMLGCCASFVLAIAGHRRPGKLERQKNEKKDREPAAHGRDCISDSLCRKPTAGYARRYPPPADLRPSRQTLPST